MRTAVAVLLLVSVAQAQNLTSDIPYADSEHERQVLDIYTPDGAKDIPVVFWIHGGGWQTGDKTDVQIKPRVFTERGLVFVSVNYRLLPQVEMGELIRDVAKSVSWVHKNIARHGGDPEQIIVMGHSAGAQRHPRPWRLMRELLRALLREAKDRARLHFNDLTVRRAPERLVLLDRQRRLGFRIGDVGEAVDLLGVKTARG